MSTCIIRATTFILGFVFGIRNFNDFSQNFIELVTARLFISSPLDDDVQAWLLYSFSGIGPVRFLEQFIIASVSMSDVSKSRKLNSACQC
jgi:hypothetical protein